MLVCEACGEKFSVPTKIRLKEDVDGEGHWQKQIYEACPYCGCFYFYKEDKRNE